jgi:hypothetical protein
VVLDDDEQRDEQEASDDDGCSERDKVEGEQGKDGCRNDRSQRDVTSDEKDDQKDTQNGERAWPGKCEEDSESACDPFAAAKTEPDGEDVAKNGRDCGSDGDVIISRCKMLSNLYSDEGLTKIEQQRSNTETLGSGAGNIGGTDVAAASGSNVLLAKDYLDEFTKR